MVFVDTGYWIALLDKSDTLHRKSLGFLPLLKTTRIYTSEMVLTEMLNYFSKAGATVREAATRLVTMLRQAPNVTIVPQNSEIFALALARYESMHDKAWGLTDCASFIVMEANGITQALAYDKHFVQAGFQALLREI